MEIHVPLQGYFEWIFDSKRVAKRSGLRVWYLRERREKWKPAWHTQVWTQRSFHWLTRLHRRLEILWAIWMEGRIEISLLKEASETSERRTIITTLGPLETSWYKTRQRHICNCIVNLCYWQRIRILTMNPSAPHMVTVIGNPNERYKRRLTGFEVRPVISIQIDPICFQVLLRSMTIT